MLDPLDFTGKNVFVIGGSSGIGNGIARAFFERGANVYASGTRPRAEDYDGGDGSDLSGLHYVELRLGDADTVDKFTPPFSRLDVLVLSQGTVVYGQGEYQRTGWDMVMAVNLHSVMDCARRFHGMLAETKGSLVIVGSISGFLSNRGNPAYASSKAAVHHLTATLGEAWCRDGIRVNGIAPGAVPTKLTAISVNHPQRLETTLRNIPLHRLGTPAEMGNVVLFLASPLASYVIGQVICVDGGLTLSR